MDQSEVVVSTFIAFPVCDAIPLMPFYPPHLILPACLCCRLQYRTALSFACQLIQTNPRHFRLEANLVSLHNQPDRPLSQGKNDLPIIAITPCNALCTDPETMNDLEVALKAQLVAFRVPCEQLELRLVETCQMDDTLLSMSHAKQPPSW